MDMVLLISLHLPTSQVLVVVVERCGSKVVEELLLFNMVLARAYNKILQFYLGLSETRLVDQWVF